MWWLRRLLVVVDCRLAVGLLKLRVRTLHRPCRCRRHRCLSTPFPRRRCRRGAPAPTFLWWSPGENLGPGLPGRMTVLCPRQHNLHGGVILETLKVWLGCCVCWQCCVLVVVVRPAWGRRWCVSLFGWPSRGLGHLDVLAQDPPMVSIVVWRPSGSWCLLGSSLLNDDTNDASQKPANRLDVRW